MNTDKPEIIIGSALDKSPNKSVTLDLERLIESRMMVQATSGAGKSYLIRTILEGALPHMPAFIIDREGEFASLREAFDVLLVGTNGELPCDVKSAALLGRRLVEHGVSAVIDLSDLKTRDRAQFVANFLDSLINLPKKLWPSRAGKATLVVVDEAHTFCPEKAPCVAKQAVIDLQSLGRKRGFAGLLATQRISKLSKDAAAECSNIVVGRTSPVDQRRAADEIGIPAADRQQLARMNTGAWYAFGPAFQPGLQFFKGKEAKTTHAKVRGQLQPPKPSKAIMGVLPEFEGIAAQADQEAKDLDEARKEIKTLRAQMKKAEKGAPAPQVDQKQIDRAIAAAYKGREAQWNRQLAQANQMGQTLGRRIQKILKTVVETAGTPINPEVLTVEGCEPVPPPPADATNAKVEWKYKPPVKFDAPVERPKATCANGDLTTTDSEQKVVDSIRWWEQIGVAQPKKPLVAIMAGYKMSGSFNSMLGNLREKGVIEYPGAGLVALTDGARDLAHSTEGVHTIETLHAAWRSKLTDSQRRVFDILIENHPEPMTTAEIAEAAGYQQSGSFNSILADLRKYGIIDRRAGVVECTGLIFPDDIT